MASNFEKFKSFIYRIGSDVFWFVLLWILVIHGIFVLLTSMAVGFFAYGREFYLIYSLFIASASFLLSTPILLRLSKTINNRPQEDFIYGYVFLGFVGGVVASILLIVISLIQRVFVTPNPLFGVIFVPVFAVLFPLYFQIRNNTKMKRSFLRDKISELFPKDWWIPYIVWLGIHIFGYVVCLGVGFLIFGFTGFKSNTAVFAWEITKTSFLIATPLFVPALYDSKREPFYMGALAGGIAGGMLGLIIAFLRSWTIINPIQLANTVATTAYIVAFLGIFLGLIIMRPTKLPN